MNKDVQSEVGEEPKTIKKGATIAGAQRRLNLNPPENNKEWKNLFYENSMAARGMNLNFVSPTMKNGKKIIELNKLEFEKENAKWKQALILYVVGVTLTI